MNKISRRTYFRDDALLTRIGLNLRRIREAQGISIETLANSCEIDYSQLSRMELGKVNFSVSFLAKIADALGVGAGELME